MGGAINIKFDLKNKGSVEVKVDVADKTGDEYGLMGILAMMQKRTPEGKKVDEKTRKVSENKNLDK